MSTASPISGGGRPRAPQQQLLDASDASAQSHADTRDVPAEVQLELDGATNTLRMTGHAEIAGHTRVYKQVLAGPREYFCEVRDDAAPWRRWLARRGGDGSRGSGAADVAAASPLERAADAFANAAVMLGCALSGTLGGMAALTLLQGYLFHLNVLGDDRAALLQFQAPVALTLNRLYWVLTALALPCAVSRSAWLCLTLGPSVDPDAAAIEPVAAAARTLHMRAASHIAAVAYALAFVLNIATAQLDAELAYAAARDAHFFARPLPLPFEARVARWRALVAVKCAALVVAWLAIAWETQPRSLGRIARSLAHAQAAKLHVDDGNSGVAPRGPQAHPDAGSTALAAWRPARRRASASDASDATASTVVENPVFAPGHHQPSDQHERTDGPGPSHG